MSERGALSAEQLAALSPCDRAFVEWVGQGAWPIDENDEERRYIYETFCAGWRERGAHELLLGIALRARKAAP